MKKLFTIDEVVTCLNLDKTKVFIDDTGVKIKKDEEGIYYLLPLGDKTYVNKIDLSDDDNIYKLAF